MMSPHTRTKYRTFLAWTGFITLYIVLPLILSLAIYTLANANRTTTTPTDRTDAFYQQVAPTL